MKKTLLPLVAVILVLGLIGCQEEAFDGTVHAPSTQGVDAATIATTVYDGSILVTWDRVNDAASYAVYRQTWDAAAAAFDEKTFVSLSTAAESDNLKKPFKLDTAVVNGEKYRYGIVANGWKTSTGEGPVSDIVWQADDATFPTAKKNTAGTKLINPDLPTVTATEIVKINSTVAANTVDVWEDIIIPIAGLNPAYNYTFQLQSSQNTTVAGGGWQNLGNPVQVNGSIGNYPFLIEGGKYTAKFSLGVGVLHNAVVNVGAGNNGADILYTNYGLRLTVTYSVNTNNGNNGYLITTTPTGAGALPANQQVITGATFTATPTT